MGSQAADDTLSKSIMEGLGKQTFDTEDYLRQATLRRMQNGVVNSREQEQLLKDGILRSDDVYGSVSSLPAGERGYDKPENLIEQWERLGIDWKDIKDGLDPAMPKPIEVEPPPMPVLVID